MHNDKMASVIKVYVLGRHSSLNSPATESTKPLEHVAALFIADIFQPALLCHPLPEDWKYCLGFYNSRILYLAK
jgi:hypothetical protein